MQPAIRPVRFSREGHRLSGAFAAAGTPSRAFAAPSPGSFYTVRDLGRPNGTGFESDSFGDSGAVPGACEQKLCKDGRCGAEPSRGSIM